MVISNKNHIPNLFFAIIIALPVINDIFVFITKASFGLSYPIVGMFLVFVLFIKGYKIPIPQIIVVVVFLFLFLFSLSIYGNNSVLTDYFTSFIYYGFVPMIYYGFKKDAQIILKITSYIAVIAIIFYLTIGYNSFDGSENMRRSNILVPLGLSIIYMLQFSTTKKRNKFIFMIYFTSLTILVFLLISWGTRGALLALVFYPMMLVISKNKGLLKYLLIFITFFIIIFIYVYLRDFLIVLKNIFDSLNISSVSIEKTIYFIDTDNLSNNRLQIWNNAIATIVHRPFFGIGISGFELSFGYYAHNFVLQLIVESGIFIGGFTTFLIVASLLRSLFSSRIDISDDYIIYLFSSSIVVLSFTSVIWYFPLFWFLIFEIVGKSKNLVYRL